MVDSYEFNVRGLKSYTSMSAYINTWNKNYLDKIKGIPIFNSGETAQWSLEQKSHFVKVFYHCRGHFHELMWFIANHAPDKKSKDIILENFAEEMGKHGFSHEKLYSFVAEAVGVDINQEYIEQESYLPFCKDFNQGHLRWLNKHDWASKLAAFAALEYLDNVDYLTAKQLAESIGLKGKALTFFNVHIHVDHFESVLEGGLHEIWQQTPEKIDEAFEFIGNHQITMWQNLSDEVFNYKLQ